MSIAVPPASRLAAHEVTVGYGERAIINQLSTAIPTGKVTVIIGPNASGKSTLLRALARLLRPTTGSVVLDGEDIRRCPTKQVARRLGLLPQSPIAPEGILVRDLIGRGRTPHQSIFRQWSTADAAAVDAALADTGTEELADRPIDELSGGQRQRVWIAMALAQDTELLLLDEPTTYLDIAHQLDVLNLVQRLNRERQRTIVMVLHDLNMAARYANHLIAMRDGEILASGDRTAVMTADNLRRIFQLDAQVITCPETGAPLVVPAASCN